MCGSEPCHGTVPFTECHDGQVRGNGLGWDRTSTIFLSPCHLFLDSSECLLWGLRLCWEKYLNLPLLPAASPKICLGLVFPVFLSRPLLPILHMKGAMEEATGPNAEPPALFLVFLFGFYLTVSKPRPHTHNAQTMQINRKTVNVCTAGMIVYKRIVVDLI